MYNYWDRIKTPIEEYTKKTSLKDSSKTSYNPLSKPISIPITKPIVSPGTTNLISGSAGGSGLTPILNSNNNSGNGTNPLNIPIIGGSPSNTNLAPIPSLPIPILKQSQIINAITPSSHSPLPGIVSNKISIPSEVTEYLLQQQQLSNSTNQLNGVDINNNKILLTNHIRSNSGHLYNTSDNIMSPFFGGGLSSSSNNNNNNINNSGNSPSQNININNSSNQYNNSPSLSQSFNKPPVSFSHYIQQTLLAQSQPQTPSSAQSPQLQQLQQSQQLQSPQQSSQQPPPQSLNSPNILGLTSNQLFKQSKPLSFSNTFLKGSLSPTINFPFGNKVYNDGADVISTPKQQQQTPEEITPETSDEDKFENHEPNSIELKPISEETERNQNLSPEVITLASNVNNDHIINVKSQSLGLKKNKKRRSKYLTEGAERMKKFRNSVYQILVPEQKIPIHIVDPEEMENTVIPFLMELGRAQLMSGVPAHRLEFQLTLVSSTFGIDGHFFSTPTGIFFSFGSPHTILSPYTHFLRIHGQDYNMSRLVLLEELADLVIYGKIDCKEGLLRLKNILKAKPLYNDYILLISFLLSSFAIAFFFNAGWVEVGACTLVGLYVGLLYLAAGRWPTIGRILEALSAFGGAIIASLFNAYVYPVHIFMVSLAGIIALAPGLSLTVAMAEISTRNLISGNARLMGVFSCLLQLTFGIALGSKVCANTLPLREEITTNVPPSWVMFLAVPLAAISFAVQMKVHPRQIWVITLASALGVVCGNWGNKFFGNDIGSFFGSMGICMLGNLYARFTNSPSAVPIMSGILLLVPGSMGVRGLFQVSLGDVNGGVEFFSGMFMIAMSLTMGLLIANLIIRPNKSL